MGKRNRERLERIRLGEEKPFVPPNAWIPDVPADVNTRLLMGVFHVLTNSQLRTLEGLGSTPRRKR